MTAFFAAILAWFAFGEIGFFVGLLALSVVYTIATERDIHGFAIFATILGVGLFWNSIVALGAIAWPFLLIGVGVYVLAGGAWSVFRWFKYCRDFVTKNPYQGVTDYSEGSGRKLSAQEYFSKKLKPSEHKSRLIGWIAYWPWSLIWNIVGDTLTAIYDALANVYQKTADAVIKKALGNIR
jgi:hypothetical protein